MLQRLSKECKKKLKESFNLFATCILNTIISVKYVFLSTLTTLFDFSKVFGKILVLDGAINYVERDEFCYNEMIANLPLNCHPQPKKVFQTTNHGNDKCSHR